MPFPKNVKEAALVACQRHCCSCSKHCGNNIECHHIVQEADGGADDFDNCIPLCFDCHANVNQYNNQHPRGNKYTTSELKKLRKKCYEKFAVQVDEIIKTEALEQLQKDVQSLRSETDQPTSKFAIAASEFSARTCRIGFLHGRQYVTTGLCCFIHEYTVITSGKVIDLLADILKVRAGYPAIWATCGMARFEVSQRFSDDIAILKAEPFDTKVWDQKVKEQKLGPNYEGIPLQTPIQARQYLYPGDRIGFLNAPKNSEGIRWMLQPQFEETTVSFRQKTEPMTISYLVAMPCLSKIEYDGAPVFTENAQLVGVTSNIIQLEEELLWRPVVASLLLTKGVFSW